jgi:hypothetical protein
MPWSNDILNDRFSYKKKSLYKIAKTRGELRENLSFDYTNEVISRSVSKHLLRVPIIYYFTVYVNDYFVNLINTTKQVKIFRVFSVDKDYEYIN